MNNTKFIRLNEKNTEEIKRMFFNLKKRLKEIEHEIDLVRLKRIREQLKRKM